MLWKCFTQYASKFGKLSSGHGTGKGQFSFQSLRKALPKDAQTTTQFHMLAKKCSKFSKLGFNSTWTMKFQILKLDLEKAEGPEIKLPTSVGSLKNQEHSRKTPTSAFLTMPKPLTVWVTTNCGKWAYQTTWPASWEICMQVKKQQLELDMEQQTDSKLGKGYVKAVYCHLAYLTYMQSTSWDTLGQMKPKRESRFMGEISITSDRQMTPPLLQKAKKN